MHSSTPQNIRFLVHFKKWSILCKIILVSVHYRMSFITPTVQKNHKHFTKYVSVLQINLQYSHIFFAVFQSILQYSTITIPYCKILYIHNTRTINRSFIQNQKRKLFPRGLNFYWLSLAVCGLLYRRNCPFPTVAECYAFSKTVPVFGVA